MNHYRIRFDDYVNYYWDTETRPQRELVYAARTGTGALRQFREQFPFYQINSIGRI